MAKIANMRKIVAKNSRPRVDVLAHSLHRAQDRLNPSLLFLQGNRRSCHVSLWAKSCRCYWVRTTPRGGSLTQPEPAWVSTSFPTSPTPSLQTRAPPRTPVTWTPPTTKRRRRCHPQTPSSSTVGLPSPPTAPRSQGLPRTNLQGVKLPRNVVYHLPLWSTRLALCLTRRCFQKRPRTSLRSPAAPTGPPAGSRGLAHRLGTTLTHCPPASPRLRACRQQRELKTCTWPSCWRRRPRCLQTRSGTTVEDASPCSSRTWCTNTLSLHPAADIILDRLKGQILYFCLGEQETLSWSLYVCNLCLDICVMSWTLFSLLDCYNDSNSFAYSPNLVDGERRGVSYWDNA